MKKTLILTYLYVILCTIATAQQVDTLALDIDEVIVSEHRLNIPFSDVSRHITIISKEEIQLFQAQSINEVLQYVSGIDLRQRGVHGVQADLSIRGGTFEQALVLINGVKMLDPQTGHHMMNLPITVEDIERIEVLKGPGARVYGQNAFAGAINIITRTRTTMGGVAGIDIGDNGLLNTVASLDIPLEGIQQKISGSFNHADGYRENTDYNIANLFYQADVSMGHTPLHLQAGYTSRDFGANGFYGNESFTEQYEETRTSFVSLGSEIYTGSWKILPRASWRRNKDNWQFRRSDPEFFQNFHTSDVVTSELHTSYTHSSGILGLGIEYNNVQLSSNNLGERSRDQIGIHLEHRWLLLDDKLDITPGIFALHISDFGSQLFPGLDIGYQVSASAKLFANLGRTSRIPSFTDLYYEDPGNQGNPNLQSESAYTFEIGGKYNVGTSTVQMSYFRRDAADLIDWFKVNPDDRWTPDNFGSATYNGIDVNWKVNFAHEDFVSISYLYLDASLGDTDFARSRNALENLRHQLILQSRWNPIDRISLGLGVRYNDRVNLDNYTVVDAKLSYTWTGLDIYLKATNVLDVTYRETNLVTMPGRWIISGFRYRF